MNRLTRTAVVVSAATGMVLASATAALADITVPASGSTVSTVGTVASGTGITAGDQVQVVVEPNGNAGCTATTQADLTWSCVISPVAVPGTYSVSAQDITAPGTPDLGTVTNVTFAAPTGSLVTPATGSTVSTAGTTASGTGIAPGNQVNVVVEPNGNAGCTAITRPDLTWSCVISTVAVPGTYDVSAEDVTAPGSPVLGTNTDITFVAPTTPPPTTAPPTTISVTPTRPALPVTGPNTSLMMVAGAVLVAIGVPMVWAARRRRAED